MAVFGWVLGLIWGDGEPVLTAVVCGGFLGLLGLRPAKVALGLAVGVALGLLFTIPDPAPAAALVGAAVGLVYRSVSAFLYRNRPLVRVMAEEVPAAQLRYIVPFEARTRYVGADYVEQLAQVRGGRYERNPPDVGSSPRSTTSRGRPSTRRACTR